MSFFKIRRTKMLDDAVLNHKPQSAFTVILVFYLVFIIANFISEVILSIPTAIWMFSYEGFSEMLSGYTASIMAGGGDNSEYIKFMEMMTASTPSWLLLISYVSFIGVIATVIFYCKRFEKRPISSLGLRKKSMLTEYGIGALIGAVTSSLAVLIALLSGSISLKVAQDGFNFMILLFLLGFIIQGIGEELIFRGYLMISIARDYRIAVAITISTVVFALLGGGGEISALYVINSALFGIFLGVYVFKRGSLWGACAIHTMWNFIGGCIFGTTIDGVNKLPSVFTMEIKNNMTLANGGVSGIEGSISATIVLLLAVSLVFLLKTKKGEESLSDATEFE